MNEVFIQIAVGVVASIGGLYALIKYISKTNAKREETILDHNEKVMKQMLEYFEVKNGHMERIAGRFSTAVDKMSDTLGELRTEIRVLNENHKKHD